jgi:hypothetical protein
MQGAKEASAGDPVHHQFPAFGQVNKYDFVSVSHFSQPLPSLPIPAYQQGFGPVGKAAT